MKAGTQKVKIAIAQILCLDGDREGNFLRIENALIQAKEQLADLIAFPEASILGWVNADAHFRAEPIPGKDAERLCGLARKYQIHLCIGLNEKEEEELYDSAILIDDTGKILAKHRKINLLAELMSPPYTRGSRDIALADTKFGRIAMMICADSFQEDLLELANQKRPDLLIIPYGWAAAAGAWPDHGMELKKVVQNAALTINAPVVGTNLVGAISKGPWAGKVYGGQSVIYTKEGELVEVGKDRSPDLLVIELNV